AWRPVRRPAGSVRYRRQDRGQTDQSVRLARGAVVGSGRRIRRDSHENPNKTVRSRRVSDGGPRRGSGRPRRPGDVGQGRSGAHRDTRSRATHRTTTALESRRLGGATSPRGAQRQHRLNRHAPGYATHVGGETVYLPSSPATVISTCWSSPV